jgi:uncharacterized protein (DUF934 family)
MAVLIRRGGTEKLQSPEARAARAGALELANAGSSTAGAIEEGEVLRLEPADDPAAIAHRLGSVSRVEVNFPSFTDGRGYSIARLLRERYGYRGELRAVGDVQRDQLFNLARCGFDAFLLRKGEDAADAPAAFNEFSEAYQASVERPLPRFRRR